MSAPEPSAALSVAIVDDHALFRRGLRGLLEEHGLTVTGEASDGAQGVELVARTRPDVVMMDLSMPGTTGVEAIAQLQSRAPGIPVVVLTVSSSEADLLDALAAGAAGYLLKDAGVDEIIRALEAAVRGESALSSRMAARLVEHVRGRPAAVAGNEPRVAELSDREVQILRMVAAGMDNNQIGTELHLSASTVKSHVSAILSELGVDNRIQAAVWAVRAGLA